MGRQGLNRLKQLKSLQEVFVLSSITLIKLLFFHRFIGITQKYWTITLLNGLTIFGIYLWINITNHPKKQRFLLSTHFFISLLLFANTMYFSHFSTLMPIHIFYQIKHLKGVSNSVKNLMQLKYLLFFIDMLFLLIYQRRIRSTPNFNRKKRLRGYLVILLIVVIVLGGTQSLYSNATGYYTPLNLGVVNYHIYDIVNFMLGKVPTEEYESTWIEVLEEEQPSKEIAQYFGIAKGRNVIMIQAESLQSFVLNRQVNGQWLTPVLNQLMEDNSLYFSRYYEQVGWGNTSDAEFVSQTGYHASIKNFSFKQYEGKTLITLPNVLKKHGYRTMVFHGNEASFWNRDDFYPFLGVDEFISKEKLEEEEIIGMGIGDRDLFRQAISHLKEVTKPFYSFFITLTSHYPYQMEEEHKLIEVGALYEGSVVGGYFETINYLDTAIGELIQSLKDEGLYEDSIIIIYGDHHGLKPYNEETSILMREFLGKEYREEEMLRVPLIIHLPNSELSGEITNVGGQVDLFPTLSNLLGVDTNDFQFIGKDLLNTESNFAINMLHTARGSFIKGDYIFTMSKDGLYENSKAWNVFTGEEISIDTQEIQEGYERALTEIELSEYILDNELQIKEEEIEEEPLKEP